MSSADRRRGVALLSVLLAAILGACSSGSASSPAASVPVVAAPSGSEAAASPTPSPTPAFPVTVTDDEGTSVELAAEPKKIVSLTPATTEILFALGAGDRIVATDDGSDHPEQAVALPDVATFSSVDVEKVVALSPDLVVAGGLGFTPAESITKLRDLKIPVVVIYAPSVEGVLKDIELLGTATGTSADAASITSAMRADMDAVAAAVATKSPKPRVFYDVGYDDTTGAIYAPADDSFLAEMVTMAGGDAITSGDPNTYEIPLEKLIEKDPQLIVLGTNPFYSPTPDAVAKRRGWDAFSAVRSGAIKPVNDIEITRPGPRLPMGLRTLAAAIWPDVTLPSPS
ncbi:MAG TPA: helical backbone metal receptor [Patescibacteria group bacterium]|jgi:iron complex transport system substrate-binding protein|nr:helical backbone metal receptor [Patescibacteria group bacterium]